MRKTILLLLLFGALLAATAAQAAPRILILGDSLSAAYGIDPDAGWTELLAKRLQEQGLDYEVVNASITGDTTRGGLARLPRLLERHEPAIVILELGGNDGLRGLSLDSMRDNLDRMIALSRDQGAEVLLLGIQLPPNYGPAYTEAFHRVYLDLAAQRDVALVPFFLAGVAEREELFLADRIHPNEDAQPQLMENVWAGLVTMINARAASRSVSSAPRQAASP